MLNDTIRTTEEAYVSATQSSNLRCEPDKRTDVDVLLASGMTPGILGGALMRLHSEWDGAERLRAAAPADFAKTAEPRKPLAAMATAAGNAAAAKALADAANEQAMILLMGKLKSLPRVLEVVEAWAVKRGLGEPKRLAQYVVAHWLAPGCPHCHGRGHELIAGTPSLGRRCKACHGSGRRKEPMGEAGRKALNMLDECVQVARASMSKRLRQSRG